MLSNPPTLVHQPEVIDHVTALGLHLERSFTDAYGLELIKPPRALPRPSSRPARIISLCIRQCTWADGIA